jgi:hypothetical protein
VQLFRTKLIFISLAARTVATNREILQRKEISEWGKADGSQTEMCTVEM